MAVGQVPFIRSSGGGGGGGELTPTLWVNSATGDDSRSKATVAGSGGSLPWQTIGRAAWGSTNRAAPNSAQAAAAGDVVAIAAGTYDYSGVINNRWDAVYNPVNEGTSGNSITFLASGTVTLTAASAAAPVIGTDGRDYVTWTGPFNIDEANCLCTPDTGPVVLHGTTGSTIEGATIDGNNGSWSGDNHNGVRVEGAESCTIRNCTILNIRYADLSDNHNAAGVMIYDSNDTLIEHNSFTNCGSMVFVKGAFLSTDPNDGTIVRFNYGEDIVAQGIVASFSRNGRYYQNVIVNCPEPIVVFGFAAPTYQHPVGDWIFNNTTVGGTLSSVTVLGEAFCEGVRLWNNIHYMSGGGVIALYNEGSTFADNTRISIEHNCYFGYSTFYQGSDGSRTFASYLSTFTDQDDDATASINDDPDFVNPASDWHLQGGSPALTIGYAINGIGGSEGTTIPAGAYITGSETIGPE